MADLYEDVVRVGMMGLREGEQLAWLHSQGHKDVDGQRLRDLTRAIRRDGWKRLAAIGAAAASYHADAVVELKAVRSELWRTYYGVRDPPPPEQSPELSAVQRAQWQAAAAEMRSKILRRILDVEPYLTAYVEAAEIRTGGGSAQGSAQGSAGPPGQAAYVSPASAHALGVSSPSPPAQPPPSAPRALAPTTPAAKPPAAERTPSTEATQATQAPQYRAVPDPDNPGQTLVVPLHAA